jgi:NADPH-dependent 2,4-dienoyl-CoA reductase/sulfur reductase-like enzyme
MVPLKCNEKETDEMEKIVVIGGVAAGPKAACHVKRLIPDAQVVMIDQDDLISYGGCGIPYLIGGEVSDEKALRSTSYQMVRNESFFEEAKGLEVMTGTRVTEIDRDKKVVHIEDVQTGKNGLVDYDKLVLATGSRPNRLPIPGNDLFGVFAIGSLHSAVNVQKWLAKEYIDKAVIIGGGAIGVEMAEAIEDMWGLDTSIVEFFPQLLPRTIEWSISRMLQHHLNENNIDVFTSERVVELLGNEGGRVNGVVTDKRSLPADVVIMATGVKPRDELAKEAGLLVSPNGGIIVNNRMQTSDPDIFAAGDCVEMLHLVSGKKTYAPFGSLANRQGRVVGDNLAGIPSTFEGVTGSFIMKAYDVCVGATGLSLEAARAEGFDAEMVITNQADRAHFLPTQSMISLAMIFDKTTRRVLGLQGFGAMGDSVAVRINAAVGMIAKGAVIEDFSNLEMTYAPPFSTAVDALNATANVADNLARGKFRTVDLEKFIDWLTDPSTHPDWIALDTRAAKDARPFCIRFGDRWQSIPYPEIRKRYQELPPGKQAIIICGAGTRSYEVQVVLDETKYNNSLVLGGGLILLRRLGLDMLPD